ncbi:methyl-accepting chemotaxis protein [Asticcacaulis sp. SL142]|uniref:methyl-accepting chemotaxis protein n=1 Tax=Asticcacaulis sp. SL142 TaxID=2995155 RepID=UPI00226D2F60|nr:methyl-accepting chemotaxis protein [Asticcacaulis sp. SL142]WAC47173.1 methyl-accepting chemotaxis protein [Asticcacaulis sp. SL142]
MKLQDLNIATKLFLLVGMMAAVTAIVAMFGVLRIDTSNDSLITVNEVNTAATQAARMSENAIVLNRAEYRVVGDTSAVNIGSSDEVVQLNKQQFAERLAAAEATADAEEKAQLIEIKTHYAHYLDALNTTFQMARQFEGQITAGEKQQALINQVQISRQRADDLQDSVKAYVDHIDQRGTNLANTAKSQGTRAILIMIAVAAAGVVAGMAIALFFTRGQLVRPIVSLTAAMEAVARGEDHVKVPGAERKDEIGAMSRAFGDNAKRVADLAERQREQEAIAARERKADTLKLADDFEKSVGGIVTLVSAAATEMQAAATQLTATAEETAAQSVAVSAAAEEAGTNVTSVASAAEELGASVSEIGRQVEASARISSEAVNEATQAAQVVLDLNAVATSIGDVIDVISGLASQTNLLALNATIESARAGDAGKGFAVVASEVKQLAGQTALATTDISAKVAQIQASTGRAVAAIEGISGTIRQLCETSAAIASAVEQQNAATSEIIQAVNQASLGTSEVTSNISGVSQAAEQTGAAASQVLGSSNELAEQAERLHLEMDRFLANVRAS